PDSGMVRDLVIDPSGSSDRVIYIGTDSGGVWKTQDGGATWVPKTDFLPSLNIGAIALDPGNSSIVYAGSGNASNQFASSGAGIFTSTDSGANFPSSSNIFTVAKGAPANFGYLSFAQSTKPDRFTIYVNAQLTSGSANAGVFKSGLLGISWSQISVNTSD